jgi:hypothetical protein
MKHNLDNNAEGDGISKVRMPGVPFAETKDPAISMGTSIPVAKYGRLSSAAPD